MGVPPVVSSERLAIKWYHFLVPSTLFHLLLIYFLSPYLNAQKELWIAATQTAPKVRITSPFDTTQYGFDEISDSSDALDNANDAVSPDDDPFRRDETPSELDSNQALPDFEPPHPNVSPKISAPSIPQTTKSGDEKTPRDIPQEMPHTDDSSSTEQATPSQPNNPSSTGMAPPSDFPAANGSSTPSLHTGQSSSSNSSFAQIKGQNAGASLNRPSNSENSAEEKIWRLYTQTLSRHFKKTKKYPPMAQRLKLTGTVWILLEIQRDGTILHASVDKSSGHEILDDAALKAALNAVPIPPFPESVTAQTRKIRIPYKYALN